MLKRIVSMLLCLLMLVGAVAPSVSAAETVPSSTGLSSDDIFFADGSEVIYNDDGSFTVTSSSKKETGSSASANAPTVSAVPEELGQASATVEDTTVDALGVPKDSTLTVAAPKAEAEPVIDEMVAKRDGTSSELFRYDISVQDKAGLDWQPNGKVRLEMDAGRKLHKNEEVYVVHVSDDGKANIIEAQVNDAGKIVFETDGFSTFAGFTVDFEYENAKFSIKGLTSILLSEVFDKLGMPVDVEDVKDVAFTDYSLISIEKQGSDWLLTSLEAFTSTEKLTLTMVNGQVYDIKVTDDLGYAKMYLMTDDGIQGQDVEVSNAKRNGVVSLYLDSTGSPTSGDGGWAAGYALQVVGPGAITIVLQEGTESSSLVWNLKQLKITGGAEVCIRLGGSFEGTETITIKGQTNKAMFDIQDGSLYFNLHDSEDTAFMPDVGTAEGDSDFTVSTDKMKVIIDGNNKATNKQCALFYCGLNAKKLVLNDLTFKNNDFRGIYCLADKMEVMRLRDCRFGESVGYLNGGGGAIRIEERTKNTSYPESTDKEVQVVDLDLINVYFNQSYAATTVTGDGTYEGGAFACQGNLDNTNFTDCTFYKCKARDRGGAVLIGSGNDSTGFGMGNFTFTNCTFTDCTAPTSYGGAVIFRDYNLGTIKFDTCTFTGSTAASHGGAINISNGDAAVNPSSVTITGCTFTNCTAVARGGAVRMWFATATPVTIENSGFSGCTSGSWGGAVSVQGVVGNFSVSGVKTDATNGNYTFRNCSAVYRGGAVGFDCTSYGALSLTNTVFDTCVSEKSLGGGVHVGVEAENATIPTITSVSVTGSSFSGCTADGVGGALALTEGTYGSITVQTSTFTECFSSNYGGAIAMKVYKDSEASARPFKVTGAVLVEDCTFSKCSAGALTPEPLDTDGDGVGDKTTWDHDGDSSTAEIERLNGTGGGGAIAIGGEVGTSITIKDTTKDDAIEFQNCYTWNNGGALCFMGTVKTPLINIENLDIDACRARDAGSAIHLSNLIANDLTMTNCDLTNNKYFTRPNTAASTGGFTSTLALMNDAYFVK